MAQLLPTLAITGAIASTVTQNLPLNGQPRNLTVQANFIYGSGGTAVDFYVQTSFDGGATWCDVANFHFTTASARKIINLSAATPEAMQISALDGSIAANTAQDGMLGPLLRGKYMSSGTYGGNTSLRVDIATDQLSGLYNS